MAIAMMTPPIAAALFFFIQLYLAKLSKYTKTPRAGIIKINLIYSSPLRRGMGELLRRVPVRLILKSTFVFIFASLNLSFQ